MILNCSPIQWWTCFHRHRHHHLKVPPGVHIYLLVHNIYIENLMLAKHHTTPPAPATPRMMKTKILTSSTRDRTYAIVANRKGLWN